MADEAQSDQGGVEVNEAELPGADGGLEGAGGGIDILLETTALPVSAQLGEVRMRVRELLQLATGSVVTLDKQVGEPVDLFLRDTKFATGQLVVVGDRLGVRIEQIVSRAPAVPAGTAAAAEGEA